MVKQTKTLLNFTFIALFTLPFAFSKMEHRCQIFKTQINNNILEVHNVKKTYVNNSWGDQTTYRFLYDKTTGYSIGNYHPQDNNDLPQIRHFFKGKKYVNPCDLSFFCIQEKSNLNLKEINLRYGALEYLKVERNALGKLFIKDFIGYEVDEFSASEEIIEYRIMLQPINAKWQQLEAQFKELKAQQTEIENQSDELIDPLIPPELYFYNDLDIKQKNPLISDAYITKGCMHLWNKYEPLWTHKVSSLPEFDDAIRITPSFSPQPNILIENKDDKVLINGIDFQQALTHYLDSDRDDTNMALFNSILEIKEGRANKNTPYTLGKLISDFEKGREQQIKLLNKSRILNVYAVMKNNQGKDSLVWGLAEDKKTKERFHWLTDLKADILTLFNQYKDQSKKNNYINSDKIDKEFKEKQKKIRYIIRF